MAATLATGTVVDIRMEMVAGAFDCSSRWVVPGDPKKSYNTSGCRRCALRMDVRLLLFMKLGKAFSDSLSVTEKSATRIPHEAAQSWWIGTGRTLIFATILFVAFFVLLWRLFDLTIIRGHEFRGLADTNRTREIIRHAPRGILLDRTGKPLVTNIPQDRHVGNIIEPDYRRLYIYESLSQVPVGELTERD
jgi:hypothetical protein